MQCKFPRLNKKIQFVMLSLKDRIRIASGKGKKSNKHTIPDKKGPSKFNFHLNKSS